MEAKEHREKYYKTRKGLTAKMYGGQRMRAKRKGKQLEET